MTFKQLVKGVESAYKPAYINYLSTKAELKKFVKRAEKCEEEGKLEYRTMNANDVIEMANSVIRFYNIMEGIKETVRTMSKTTTKEEEKKWLEDYFIKIDDEIWNELDNKIKVEEIRRKYEKIYYQ